MGQCVRRSLHTSLSVTNRGSTYEDYEDNDDNFSRNNRRGGRQSGLGLGDEDDEFPSRRRAGRQSDLGYYDRDDDFSSRRDGGGGGGGGYRGRGGFRGGRDDYRNRNGNFGGGGGGGRQSFDFDSSEFSSIEPIDTSTLPEVKKDFFEPSEQLKARNPEENNSYLKENNITVRGENVPPPIQQFTDYNFPPQFLKQMQEFTAPTPIQAQGWSIAMSGKDFVGIGQVSGTVAFLATFLKLSFKCNETYEFFSCNAILTYTAIYIYIYLYGMAIFLYLSIYVLLFL